MKVKLIMALIYTISIFILTISIIVTFHEYGHYIAARLCGVKVKEFSIGFNWISKLCMCNNEKIYIGPAVGPAVKRTNSKRDRLTWKNEKCLMKKCFKDALLPHVMTSDNLFHFFFMVKS